MESPPRPRLADAADAVGLSALRPAFAVALPLALALIAAVARGWTHALDARLLAMLSAPAPPAPPAKPTRLTTAMRDLSALGGDTLRLLFLLALAIALFAARRATCAWLLLAIFGAARVALLALKRLARRARPDLVAHHVVTYTSSFPSGHTFMAAVLFLSTALLVPVAQSHAVQATGVALALATSLAIGATRIVLGIHWPSDVLAGWLAGIAWTLGCVLLYLGLT